MGSNAMAPSSLRMPNKTGLPAPGTAQASAGYAAVDGGLSSFVS